ncbi:MAG: hypothetical protein L0332_15535, partial [Chloroflexi bacterium]|nr:hypothetical protein [Chloroflexota bacterium]MCI0648941.1 hypothetical protein [Chloroflexota bacterium]MCI0728115.1 hypothetical protein [Chloroflexota bacterium]
AARLGPLHLEINECLGLDHRDAFITLQPRTPWGVLHLGYVVCLGEDEIRRPGFYCYRFKPIKRSRPAQPMFDMDEPFLF